MKDEEIEDIFEDIEDETIEDEFDNIEDVIQEESPSFNNNQNRFSFKNDSSIADKLSNIRNKSTLNNNTSMGASVGRDIGNEINGKSEEEKGIIEKKTDDIAGKAASTAITTASKGAISGEVADAAGEMAAQGAKKLLRQYRTPIIIGSLVILLIIIFFVALLASSEDDESETISETNGFITGDLTEEELINYLIDLNYCDNEKQCLKTNVYKFYLTFKNKYNDFQNSCPKLSDSYLKNGGLPCNIIVNHLLIFETLSYRLTDEEFLSTLSFGGESVSTVDMEDALETTVEDIDNLSLAMTEYVHEKCYVMETKEKCVIETPIPGAPSNVPKQQKTVSCNTAGAKKITYEEKVHKDLYYFQISFDKYISYLKYGNTSTHPNLEKKLPVYLGNYDDRACTGPQDETLISNSSIQGASGATTITGSGRGIDIVNYALQFVGNPYVWGGTSLTNGADCSGFIQSVFAKFGISLPRTSVDQRGAGVEVSGGLANARPGDIICYDGHVAIYMGNNQIVHASSPKTGIKISNNAAYRPIVAIRRMV